MNLKKEFNRLSGMLDDRMDTVHDFTDDLSERMRDEMDSAKKLARKQWDEHRDSLMSAEQMIERHMRDHSTLYVAAGLALLGLMLARMITHQRPEPPRRPW